MLVNKKYKEENSLRESLIHYTQESLPCLKMPHIIFFQKIYSIKTGKN